MTLNLVKKQGKGGLAFIPQIKAKDMSTMSSISRRKRVKAISYEELVESIKKHGKGEIDFLVEIASYRNPLARGLDPLHIVKYASARAIQASIKPLKSGAGLSGRDLNSGCACVATKNG